MFKIQVMHLDGKWHQPGKLAKWNGIEWTYPTFATETEAMRAAEAAYPDVYAGALRAVEVIEGKEVRAFEARIWEKAEHWYFYVTVKAVDYEAARAELLKQYPKRGYTIRAII